MKRLTPSVINKIINKYSITMYRSQVGYYYFTSTLNKHSWRDHIESIGSYSLEGYSIEEIVEHIESQRDTYIELHGNN